MSAALYAQRLAPHGVVVFELRPGIIRTDMIARVEDVYEERIRGGLLPQGRMGEPATSRAWCAPSPTDYSITAPAR